MERLKIEYLPIDALKPYNMNAKEHPQEQIEQIVASIREFGMNDPIGIWGDDCLIVEGHGRLIALQQMGETEAPTIRLDHMTDEQRRAYTLAHNQTTMNSGFNLEILNMELSEIEDIDMGEFGFEIAVPEEPQEITEDEVPEVSDDTEPTCKVGDVWKLGEHRLMCGDSTDVKCISVLMDGQNADMVFTDPPYGYKYQSNMRKNTEKFDVLMNDDKILDFMPSIKKYVSGFVFVCTTWKVLKEWLALFEQYYTLTNMIIWDKGGSGIGDLRHTFSTDYEVILCANNGNEITGKRIGSVWSIGKDNANDYVHATQKPVELSATAIKNTTTENNIVLDVFGGSGSTLIACEQLNRKCYMMELDPKYCDVIINRWERFTGKKAVLLNEGSK